MYSACWFITCWKESVVSKFRDTDVSQETQIVYIAHLRCLYPPEPPYPAYPGAFAPNYLSISW